MAASPAISGVFSTNFVTPVRPILTLTMNSALDVRTSTDRVALTFGVDGAVVASKSGVLRLPAPTIVVNSTVGAGDSFLVAIRADGFGVDQRE